ncbi:endopygalactorunase [Niabella soli DSM 19437]|uniref:Endopygalactorunase n=1 Tax=Niabella soli DSM 19437 TaxID=929713 RepID=W0EXI2_9BACT|nr:endopygalactorunase [Niabella soli DSM 19437]
MSHDTVYVVSGNTFSFTVDTPENEGLVNTTPTAAVFLSAANAQESVYTITDKNGKTKQNEVLASGDKLTIQDKKGTVRPFQLLLKTAALGGRLEVLQKSYTKNTRSDLRFEYTAGQRSPDATVRLWLPAGVNVTPENTTVNIIGRGEVLLKALSKQSVGRTGTNYPYKKTGSFTISDNGRLLILKNLDLRPANGPDLSIVIHNVTFSNTGVFSIKANYTTTAPAVLTSSDQTNAFVVTPTLSDLKRVPSPTSRYSETATLYTTTTLTWSTIGTPGLKVQSSVDDGKSWQGATASVDGSRGRAFISGLQPNKKYLFRLSVQTGPQAGFSNTVSFYSGKIDIKDFGVTGNGSDDTRQINEAIATIHKMGGGTLFFSKGVYNARTIHLMSNVWLYIDKDATIQALKRGDAPEATWFSDRKYRSGLSPTDMGPYEDPENWTTKQDVGHTFFRNALFTAERADNIKIIGNGTLTGKGNLVTSDKVMNNAPDNRSDKLFSLKLCTNIEIGGIYRKEDLWYDSAANAPYYIVKNKVRDFNTDNMLQIDRAGHFVLLATGTDNINVHDTYFAKHETSNARDIYDFMSCNNVTVTNIYSRVSSDDIVKPGSDCSLGFTRPAKNYKIRNIIGDTNCNLFQVGSETADDITDICVDNIYVLGANKAGFSISTNDGGHVKNIHLNCGETGPVHHRSKMFRTYTPFFISISNRGRVLGATAKRFRFTENGLARDELLVTNVSIGQVENILLNGVDIAEVYAGSAFSSKDKQWHPFDGTQGTATPIVAGYQLPENKNVSGGLDFRLPDGRSTGYITNIVFNDLRVLVKGGHPASDSTAIPPELGVGQYNASNLKVQPSWGFWGRHIKNIAIKNSSFAFEKPDGRYALLLDDVQNARLEGIKIQGKTTMPLINKNTRTITLK